jgi:hypothetical protein
MRKKLRGYNHFMRRQQKHKEAFGVHPIRAVLIETTDEARARKLMELVQHAAVIGEGKRAGLFWFCISPILTMPADNESPPVPRYLVKPGLILDRLWALPDFSLHALADAENSQRPMSPPR